MEEKRYDLSFMKEYQELYEISDLELARIFKCGTKKVPDVLSGKILIKESLMEEILYELSFSSYEKFKENIQNKINRKKQVLKLQEEKKNIIKIKKEKEVNNVESNIISILDLKNMTNTDMLINLLLFGNVVNKDIKQISEFLNMDTEYIDYVGNKTLNLIRKNNN